MQSFKRTAGEAMSDLLNIVKGLAVQPKCLVVLGARTEAMLNWLFSLTASQVVLVEPELAMFEKAGTLHSAKGKPENVTIIHGVPAFETEQKTTPYFTSNVLGFSSVLPPNLIKSIRPALEFTEQEVPIVALKPLLKQFNISESEPCLLIAQLNGGEQQCLNGQLLNDFTHVVIQSSPKPIFGESKPVEKVKSRLAECGRDYLGLAESMPPFSNFVATKTVNAEQALNYFSNRQQHREIKAALENQLSVSQSDAEKVTSELQQAKQQLQAAKQQAEEKQKQLQEEMQHINQKLLEERDQEHHWHNEHKKWSESLKKEKEELVKNNEELSNRLSESLSEKEKLAAEIENIKERDRKLTSSLEVNSKLVLKMQIDSDDLRTKYAQKTQSEKELRQLIGELHSKLQQAANFYHQLENKHPEILLGSDNID